MFFSPKIGNLSAAAPRLIDLGMLHYESSVAGFNERYHRGETSHTIHVWWARRPHSAMRSVVFATLCKDCSTEAAEMMAKLAVAPTEELFEEARNTIACGYEESPRVLDMFAGGGTIPFEANRLGCDTYSIDANQLSVFIQECNLVYPSVIDSQEAQKQVATSGRNVLNRLKERTNWLYPLRKISDEKCFGYIWSYRMSCEECGYTFYLTKRRWLSKKNGKHLAFELSEDLKSGEERVEIVDSATPSYEPHWKGRSLTAVCPNCGQIHDHPDATSCEDVILANVYLNDTRGKHFSVAEGRAQLPSSEEMKKAERELLLSLDMELPESQLPKWSGIVNPALSGINTHSDFINQRQRLLLLYLLDELIVEYRTLQSQNSDYAKFTIGMLSSLIDQVVDWNCRLSMWIPQNEQVGRAFCGPGIAMYWDYAETDQLLAGPANLWSKLDRIIKGVASMEHVTGAVHVKKAAAQALPFENDYFDAIVTDPPYYDNIYYSILADFFYVWKRPLLKLVEPELFDANVTDHADELVASARRAGSVSEAFKQYCEELNKAFLEAARTLKSDGVFSFVYSHASVDAWLAVIDAYRAANFEITSVQPLSIERKSRPRAMTSQAVNTCMTFVSRKRTGCRVKASATDITGFLESTAIPFGRNLVTELGWSTEDAGMATIACLVGKLSNCDTTDDVASEKHLIIELADRVQSEFEGFKLVNRSSL